MKELKFLFKLMAKYEPLMFVLIGLYGIFMGLSPFIWIVSPAYILKNANNPLSSFLVFFVLLIIFSSLTSFFDSFIMNNYRMRMNNIRYRFIRMVISYSLYLDFDKQKDKEEIEKINNAKNACISPFSGAGGIMMNLPYLFGILFSLAGFIWIFSMMGPLLLLIVGITSIISFKLTYKITGLYHAYYDEQSNNWNIFSKLNYELRNSQSKQDILVYDFLSIFRSYYMEKNKERIDGFKAINKKGIRLLSLAQLISLFRDGCIFYWLVVSILKNEIDMGDFFMFFTAIFSFINFGDQIKWQISNFRNSFASFKYFFEILNNKEDDGQNISYDIENLDTYTIEFKNVSFSYPSSDKEVLKNINLTIKEGESLALVGENGAGKSTLALILCGLYKPTSGEVLLNGINIREFGKAYNKIVAAIFQDSLLLPFSIKENITLNTKDKDLSEIYKKTKLDELISKYKKGEDQYLLRTIDQNGVDLSGGQKQRIFLARALNKASAKILILDEPTAQLDALAEKELYLLYNDLYKDKSSIFISHRLASTRFCDKVIFLKDGKIEGYDSHQGLMGTNQEYRELYEIQAKNYREEI
ncbi:MAG: ABC transporter ATP-binding protein [Peptoniphilaceae bacterium]|nr:ABC transporter ATP-binding protein [Peptoniphilaceae bacterium]MDY6019151.1 ABC transporter ATP-binding protein [Anaerococcus sp.]